ncbi:MAG: sulfatase [Bacteroidota bacterium]|nr:sulfatase [Bacteroidota bacterium]
MKKIFLLIAILLLTNACESEKSTRLTLTPNILFISVDDLRPELGINGNRVVKIPNIDQLAREGSFFSRHYVQVPTCGASRYSLMTGLRPRKRIHIDNRVFYREMANKNEEQRPESFVHHFKRNGYYTVGIGKLSHSVDGFVYGYEEKPSDVKEMPHSWDRFVFNPGKWKTGWNAFFAYANGENRQSLNGLVKPYESADVTDEGYPDGLILKSALKELRKLKAQQKPFLLGVGFFKPHLPFNAPKKYWDLYDRSSIPTASDPFIPQNVHPNSVGKMGEFYNYKLSDEKPTLARSISDEYARKLIHGYYASVSYIDHLVGELLMELKSLELDKETIVVLWGDHGWHLGNDRKWGKHSLFERSLKSALIVKIPGVNHASKEINSIVETVDLYPTLLDFCGIAKPYKLDGKSLVELIQTGKSNHPNQAFGFWKNGVSLKTDRYRVTKFFREEEPKIELYDHLLDQEENVNIAFDNQKIVDSLMPVLEKVTPEFYFK